MFISEVDGTLSSFNDFHARLDHASQTSSGSVLDPDSVTGIILHSNGISQIDGTILNLFRSLTVLDISSNLIENIEGLDAAPYLVDLNLSNNKISRVQNMKSLQRLRKLNLSFNCIRTFDGLEELRGPRYSLQVLDLKGNSINGLETLRCLEECTELRALTLDGQSTFSKRNPVCTSQTYSAHSIFACLPQLEYLDGHSRDAMRFQERDHIVPVARDKPPHQRLLPMPRSRANIEHGIVGPKLQCSSPLNAHPRKFSVPVLGELKNYPFCGAIDSTSSGKWKQKKTRSRVREVGEPRARLSLSSLSESHAVSPKIATARPKSSSVTALHITANSLAEHEAHQHYSEKAALFEALQTEVERLRTDEKQYTEQIKVLSADIHAERERRTKSEAICKLQETQLEQFITTRSRLEDLVRENQSLEAQMNEMKKASDTLTSRLDTAVSDLANTRQSLNLAHAEKANWQNDLANLRQSLDSALAEKENCQTQLREQDEILKAAKSSILSNHNALNKMEAQLHAAEEGNARLSVRLVKEREQFRVKFAEVHKESDIYKGTIRQLQKEVSSLQKEVSSSHQQLASTGRDSRQQLREISWNLNSEVKLAVEATTTMMMEKHQEEVQAISKQLMSMRDAYNFLEDEYRKGMKEERSRLSQLRKTCTELSHKCSEQVKDLQRAGFKEEEMARVIQELTLMLKDHKIQISDLTQKQKAAFATFEEKMRQMEDRAKIARKCRIDLEAAQIERSRLQGAVAVLTEERQHMLSETEQKEARYNHEIAEMHNRTKELQAEIDRIMVDRDSNERTVRVKDKMLEDQNETIRHLKQNLDNKCREHQSLVSACEKRKGELEDRIETERAARDELQQEISSQRHLLDHLQSLANGYKAERNSLRRDVSELAKKLQDRNDSIHLIEEEVARIRNVFKAKEDKWQQEKSCAIQAEKQAGLDMKIAYDAQCSRLAALEREREAMLQSLEKMQRELQAASAMKEQHESEMRLVLEELNRQKQKMDEKMKHLKALVV